MPLSNSYSPSVARALVVEPDEAVRRRVAASLREQGMEVAECGNVDAGRQLYKGQRLVIAPLNADNTAMKEFVAWLRAEAGMLQPWIIAMGTDHQLEPGETPAHYGVNDLLTAPMNAAELLRRLEAVGMGRLTESAAPVLKNTAAAGSGPPSYHRPSGFHPRAWHGASAAVVLESYPAAVAILDRSMRYLAANQRWFSQFQIPATPLAGLSQYDLFPDLHEDWRKLYERCLAEDARQCIDDVMARADGSEYVVHWEILTWRDSRGFIGGLVLICTPAQAEDGETRASVLSVVPVSSSEDPSGPDMPASTSADHSSRPEEQPAPSLSEPLEFYLRTPDPKHPAAETEFTVILRPLSDPETVSAPLSGEIAKSPGISLNPEAAVPSAGSETDSAIEFPTNGLPGSIDPAFREMVEAAPFGMVLLDDEARVLYANPQHRAVLGSSVTGEGGMAGWLQRACPGEEDFRKQTLDEWWENVWRRHNALTCSLRTAEGLVKEIEFRPAPLSGDRLLLTIFDVTDARLEEQAMRSSEARHRGLFQQSSAAFAIMNAAGNLTDVNGAFEALTGCPRQEMRRASMADFLTPGALSRLRPVEGVMDTPFSSAITHRSGKITPVRIAVSVIRNDQGQAVFTACTFMPVADPASPAGALPAVPITISRSLPAAPWGAVTPDLLLLLDEAGRILDHNHPRDFETLIPANARLTGQYLEDALPALTAPLPLDVMMERLLDAPGHEVRCAFPLDSPPGKPARELEARMIRMPAGENVEYPPFGLSIRDISSAPSPEPPTAATVPN